MNSRRDFLGASTLALAALPAHSVGAVKKYDDASSDTRTRERDYWNDLPNRMIAQVNAARAKRKAELARLKSSAAANERIEMIRTRAWELIGGKLDETPLNARTTGIVERDTYRIEKIIFESQREFYVTSNLYLPKLASSRAPAILAPLGHTEDGKSYRSYQTVFQNLARKGFVVFTWDPVGQGERLQYLKSGINSSMYGPTGEHDRFGWPALLIGSSTTQFEAWDGIRALDYLLSRPEVDPQRVGCCGHSGGGTQTMWLCALEPRIKTAIVVEGHTENLAGADYEPPGAYADAEQNIIGGLKIPIDRGDLLGAFAPKPLLILYTPVDNGTTYSAHYVRGAQEIADELRSLYALYDAKERVGLNASPLPHDYDCFQRRSTYAWFNKWLNDGRGDAEEAPFHDGPASDLWCTPTGQVQTSIGGRTAYQVNHDRLRSLREHRNVSAAKDEVQTALRKILNFPSSSSPLRPNSFARKTWNEVLIEDIEFESEPGIRVPGWFIKPSSAGSPLPTILMTEEGGKDGLFEDWSLIEKLTRAGLAICSIDLRTNGATTPRLPSQGPLFYGHEVEMAYSLVNLSIGTPILGQQTYDLLRGLEYLSGRKDVDKSRIGIFGAGVSGLPCIAGMVLDSRVRSMMLNRTLLTLESVVASKDYDLPISAATFGLLRDFDLPELCAFIAPRAVWLLNSVGPQGEPLPAGNAQEAYRGNGQISFRVHPDPIDEVIIEWARQTLR